MSAPRTVAALALALAGLSGCGSDPSEDTRFATVRAFVSGLVQGDAPQGPTDPAQLAGTIQRALQASDAPLMLAVLPEREQTALLGEFGVNGPYRTWATQEEQALVLRNGILVGTRGVGPDLMSSEVGQVAPLIRGRRAGTGQRVYRHLDGVNQEVPTVFTCRIAPAGRETVQLASGARPAVTRMVESCRSSDRRIENVYWVTSAGAIPQSRQWQGPDVGPIVIQILRE
jgi:hypothetical protein